MSSLKVLEGIARQVILSDIGMSSASIVDRYMNGDQIKHRSHPRDSSDFGRCYRMIENTGIDINIMTGVSKEWDGIVFNWSALCNSFISISKPICGNTSFYTQLKRCIE